MQKWEYRVLVRHYESSGKTDWADKDKRKGEERLNAMGQEGWELVQVVPIHHAESSAWSGLTTHLQYIFKRPGA